MAEPATVIPLPREFNIVKGDAGDWHASNSSIAMTVQGGRLFKRNAIKQAGSPGAFKVQWLVGELDGVRVYVKDTGEAVHLIMTKADLYP